MLNAHRGRMKKDYTLLVIDDEPLARLSFRKLIETRFPGFIIAEEAGTGPEGLEMYRRLKPDIVIMDIQIPDLNGLETSRLILESHPSAQIIILSAYDHFDYVQDAINYGFLGYLLKPVHEKKLEQLLDKAVQKIRSIEDYSKEHGLFQTFRDIALADMVTSFIYGSCGGLDADFYAAQGDPPVEWGYFALFKLEEAPQNESLIEEILTYLKRLPGVLPGRWIGSLLPVFIRVEPYGVIDEYLCDNMVHRLSIMCCGAVHTSIGRLEKSPADFPGSFIKALNKLESESSNQETSALEYPMNLEKRFIRDILEEQWSGAEESLNSFFQNLSLPEYVLIDCQLALVEFLIQFRRSLDDKGEYKHSKLLANMLRNIHLHQDRLTLLEWIASSLLDLLTEMKNSNSPEDLQIRKVLKYIDLNDFQEISLESAARAVGLTPQYLSRIFKDRYKVNFLEYLIKRRMEFAGSLLKNTDLPIKEIALKSGYSDVSYFNKVFKKENGYSPREFRLKH